jgi:hypothetical protein
MGDFWESDESDNEYVQNEIMPPDIDEEFKNDIVNLKHIIYENNVLTPELGTSDAQSLQLLQAYLNNINYVYILSLNAQKGQINDNELNKFPENVREPLRKILNWMANYFKKNRLADIIPYEDYIRKSFKEYQFVQDNSFE